MTNTRYNLLAETLRAAIAEGMFAPTGDLPTEAELCASYDVSRSTVRKALNSLRDEGLVTARQGSGWVETRGRTTSVLRLTVGDADVGGEEFVDRLQSCRRLRPPTDVARRLGAPAGRSILRVERVSAAATAVVHRSTTWFNAELSGSLDDESASMPGPAKMLQDRGVVIGATRQLAGADAADDDDVAAFGVDLASPILLITRLAYDEGGQPLFLSLHRHPGGDVQVQIDLPTSLQGARALVGDLEIN